MNKYMHTETGSVDTREGWIASYDPHELETRGLTAEEAFEEDEGNTLVLNKLTTLQELTGQESGIVIYGGDNMSEAVVCNWSSVQGFPRVDPLGFAVLGFGEEIQDCEGEYREDIPSFLENVEIVFANEEEMPTAGMIYRHGNITIIAPDGWN